MSASVRCQPIRVHKEVAAAVRVGIERTEAQTAGVDDFKNNLLTMFRSRLLTNERRSGLPAGERT